MSRVLWLDDLEPHDATARVGPKLGRLAELSAVGVEVPRGFAVTASACAEHEGAAGLTDVLAAALGRLDGTPAPCSRSRRWPGTSMRTICPARSSRRSPPRSRRHTASSSLR